MKTFTIHANAITTTVEADNTDAAIIAYVNDAGYSSVEAAADACNQSVDDFLADITVEG